MDSKNKSLNQSDDQEENQEIKNKYIIVDLNNENLAISLSFVQEVIDNQNLISIPKLNDKFSGIYNLRKEIIPILNLSNCIFNISENNKSIIQKKIVILKVFKEKIGVLVDDVQDIIQISDSYIKNVSSAVATKVPLNYIEKIIQYNERAIVLFNLRRLLNDEFEIAEGEYSPQGFIQKESLDLNSRQTDAMKEISTIATGQSMIALSKMLKKKKKIDIEVRDVQVKGFLEMVKEKSKLDENYVSIKVNVKNDLNAVIFLIFSSKQIVSLLKEIDMVKAPPKEIKNLENIDKNSFSAIQEIGNIIISHFCSAISDFLNIDIFHEVPEISVGSYASLIEEKIIKSSKLPKEAIFIQNKIKIGNNLINGEILFVPLLRSINNFTRLLDADRIVAMMEKGLKIPMEKLTKKVDEQLNEDLEEHESSSNIFDLVKAQKEYKLKKSDQSSLEINNDDLDAFRELGNIGAGHAGNALSQMLNKKVLLEIPPAKVLTIPELIQTFSTKKRKLVGYVGRTSGMFQGNIFLMMTTTAIENLLQLVMETNVKKDIKNEVDLDENEKSAVKEILNILLGHYISAMSNFLKVPISPPEYHFFFQQPKSLFEKFGDTIEEKNVKAITVETLIKVQDNKPIKGQFVLILNAGIVREILDRMQEVWG